MPSKSERMAEAAAKRITGGSAYDQSLQIGDDFLAELEDVDAPKGIVRKDDGSIQISKIEMSAVGLIIDENISEEEYETFGETLLRIETAYQWIVGDYLAYGVKNNYGMAQIFAEKLGRDASTIRDWTYVCNQIEISYRYDNLSFKHHRMVAPMEKEQQQYWLQTASENGWSASKLKKMMTDTPEQPTPKKSQETVLQTPEEEIQDMVSTDLSNYRKAKDPREKEMWRQRIRLASILYQQAERELEDE